MTWPDRLLRSLRMQPIWSRLHRLSLEGMNIGRGSFVETSGEVAEVRVVRLRNSSSAVVLDVGANAGDYTAMVRRGWPEVEVHLFEPNARHFSDLSRRYQGDAATAIADLDGAKQLRQPRAIDTIQYEFGGAVVDSRCYLRDFFDRLHTDFSISRLLPKGLLPLARHKETYEIFTATNFLTLLR